MNVSLVHFDLNSMKNANIPINFILNKITRNEQLTIFLNFDCKLAIDAMKLVNEKFFTLFAVILKLSSRQCSSSSQCFSQTMHWIIVESNKRELVLRQLRNMRLTINTDISYINFAKPTNRDR